MVDARPPGIDPRRSHYGEFYGLRALPDDRPLVVVHGNCQAESLRVLLDATGLWHGVRIPPVHELTAHDLPHLERLLGRVELLVHQPVRENYRSLPLGAGQIRALAGNLRARVAFPVLRFAGLFPFQVIIRCEAGDPPVVPYHDLRTLAAAAGLAARGGSAKGFNGRATIGRTAVHAARDRSVVELRQREQAHSTITVHDLFAKAGAEAVHTINHPGNVVLRGVAARIAERLAGTEVNIPDPGRELLGRLRAPLERAVIEALDLPVAPRSMWTVDGEQIDPDDIAATQRDWYAAHPEAVDAGLRRHHETMRIVGLS